MEVILLFYANRLVSLLISMCCVVVCCVALVFIYGVMEVLGRTMKIHWLPTF